jgi:hypothetical protein
MQSTPSAARLLGRLRCSPSRPPTQLGTHEHRWPRLFILRATHAAGVTQLTLIPIFWAYCRGVVEIGVERAFAVMPIFWRDLLVLLVPVKNRSHPTRRACRFSGNVS